MKSIGWVTNMRLFSVLGIVALHCYGFLLNVPNDSVVGIIEWIIRLFFKPATILFFIMSGYLFQANYVHYRQIGFGKYLLKKVKRLVVPYVVVFIIFQLSYLFFIAPYFGKDTSPANYQLIVINFFKSIFYTNYWFLPVVFLYLIVNYFISEKFLKKLIFPAILITIFYAINIYFHFTKETSHTTAIPGFLTFFFLGRFYYLGKIKIKANMLLLLVTFTFSGLESYFLNFDTNTIRFGNTFYSIFIFIYSVPFFQKVRVIPFFTSINYFFIYLIHASVILYLVAPVSAIFPNWLVNMPFIRHWLLFLVVLSISVLIEKIVFSFKNPVSMLFKL